MVGFWSNHYNRIISAASYILLMRLAAIECEMSGTSQLIFKRLIDDTWVESATYTYDANTGNGRYEGWV